MNPVLATVATGTVGAHVVRALQRCGTPVRAFVRDPEKANRLLGPEVELVVGDFADHASLAAAVDGVERVFLACANHPQQVPWETAVIDAGAAAGARGIVKLSAAPPWPATAAAGSRSARRSAVTPDRSCSRVAH